MPDAQGPLHGAPADAPRPDVAARAAGLRDAVRTAAIAFLVSRALVLAAALATGQLTAPGAPLAERATAIVLRGDAAWYVGTAAEGYAAVPYSTAVQRNWAFFPLLPLLLRGAGRVTGELPLTGALLSTGLLFVGLALLHALAVALGLSREAARRSVWCTALWPTTVFFSVPTTEALFLALSCGVLLAAVRGSFLAAGGLGALASAARPNGIALLAPLVLLWWASPGRRGRDLAAVALVPLGLGAFMLHLWWLTGNPLAFSGIQAAWGRYPGFFLGPVWEYVRHPLPIAKPWNFRLLNFAGAVAALWAVGWWCRRRSWALAAYAFAGIFMSLSSHTLQSVARYAMVIAPVPLAMADAAPRVGRVLTWAVAAVAVAAAIAVTALFALGRTFAVT